MNAMQGRNRLARAVLEACEAHACMLACAESLTGGLLADAFVRIPGASKVFLGSAVTYDIKAKASILGVDAALLRREGAVHPEVARQMAVGVASLYGHARGCEGRVLSIATTGVAGPGPDGDKPAGLVYVGVAMPKGLSLPLDDVRLPRGMSPCAPGLMASAQGVEVVAFELHLRGSRSRIRSLVVLDALRAVSQFTGISQE